MNLNRPEIICWLSVPLIALLGLLTIDHNLDIQLHDTYFVISNRDLGIVFSLFIGLTGLGYWGVNRIKGSLLRSLYYIHVFFTIGGALAILIFTLFLGDNSSYGAEYQKYSNINKALAAAILLLIISQPLYFFNLIYGFLNRKK